MSSDVCPVCGCSDLYPFNECPCHKGCTGLQCGFGVEGVGCEHAERMAIERAAEIERLKAILPPKWTDRRAFQLASDLAGLLVSCHQINTASGVIERMERIISLAGHLLLADPQTGEPSFLEFLNTLCRDARRNQDI